MVNSEPRQTCLLCGRFAVVVPDGRGFPPNIAKNRLKKICKAAGCPCEPKYTAGLVLDTGRGDVLR